MTYDSDIGYSDLNKTDIGKLSKKVSLIKSIIEKFQVITPNSSVLVAGCGNGDEAIEIQKLFNARVYGIDLFLEREMETPYLYLKKGDLGKLPFDSKKFDIIYSYHVLEHVKDPIRVLKELNRVLKNDGILFIGFPNANRLLGYIGSHNKMTILDKVKFNLNDYKYRIKGKFRNEFGAHAGFSLTEFRNLAKPLFSEINCIRDTYMEKKYENKRNMIRIIKSLKLQEFFYPSNYFICKK